MNKDFAQIFKLLSKKDSGYWTKEGEEKSLALFKTASENVPAYRDFLKKSKVNAEKINTWGDFKHIPVTSKKTYLRGYNLERLVWQGTLRDKSLVFTSTSGSTGEPFYFPRHEDLDFQYSLMLEEFLQNRNSGSGPTLVIIGFGMGVWIGGLITYRAFEMASQRGGYRLSIITPGINKNEIFKALKKLSPQFKTTILVGYPPFIKDIIDESVQAGINLKKINLRLVFAAEPFNESFRQHLVSNAGIDSPYVDTMNIYGSADIGAMAYETPISILIRKLAIARNQLFKDIFGDIKKIPTLAQFNPLFINFESIDGELILTGNNTLPLIRYAIGDNGGVISHSEIIKKIKSAGINIKTEIKKAGIKAVSKLPFVYVYERNDFSTTLYGLAIYPETVREVLLENPFSRYLTGKLTLITKSNNHQDQYLEINIELSKNSQMGQSIKATLLKRIINNLCFKNSEFRELYTHFKERAKPRLVFWPAEDSKHFLPGVKQSWVKK